MYYKIFQGNSILAQNKQCIQLNCTSSVKLGNYGTQADVSSLPHMSLIIHSLNEIHHLIARQQGHGNSSVKDTSFIVLWW